MDSRNERERWGKEWLMMMAEIGMERVFVEPVSSFMYFECVYFWTSLAGKIFWQKGGGRERGANFSKERNGERKGTRNKLYVFVMQQQVPSFPSYFPLFRFPGESDHPHHHH